MSRKIIGLTGPSSFTQECFDAIETFFQANYVALYHNNEDNINQWLETVDGVILAGGVDIHPTVYGESVWSNQNLSKFDIKRDCRELQIVDYCIKNNKPMLGICRGHQIIGVSRGLKLLMDISSSETCHQPAKSGITVSSRDPLHYVKLLEQGYFYETYKVDPNDCPERKIIKSVMVKHDPEKIWVNSFHHQALLYQKLDYKQHGVKVLGTSRVDLSDKYKEIIEFMEGENWISVQWHPEYDWAENTPSRAVLSRFKEMIHA